MSANHSNGACPLIEAAGLHKSYRCPAGDTQILAGASFCLPASGSAAIVGQSGTGKSTLLQILAGLASPDAGSVLYRGKSLADMGEAEINALRNASFGFVFQNHHLLLGFTALENVCMPLLIRKQPRRLAEKAALPLMESLGISALASKPAYALSGGEKQRAAIARALICKPSIVFADEPTGNLDEENSELAWQALRSGARLQESALAMVTHSSKLACRCDAVWELRDKMLRKLPSGAAQT